MIALLVVAIVQAPSFETVARGTRSGVSQARELLMRTPANGPLWKSHDFAQPAPAVDFSTHAVAAVFLGTGRRVYCP